MAIRPNMELTEYVAVFRRQKWIVVFSVLAGLFLASLYCSITPKRYQSTTNILLIPQRVPESYVRSTVGSRIEDRLATLQQEVMSRTRLLAVVNELQLFGNDVPTAAPEEMVQEMRKRIEVVVRGNGAFSLSFVHEDPRMAMLAASRLASFFIDENLRKREQQAVGTAEFLESQLQETKAKLEAQEERVKQYKTKFIGELPQQMDANLHTLSRLQEQIRINADAMRSAEDRKALSEGQLRMLERSWPPRPSAPSTLGGQTDVSPNPAGDPAAALYAEYAARRTELENALGRYTERYPDVVRLRREVERLEARIAEARRSVPSRATTGTSGATAPDAAATAFVPPNPNAAEIQRLKTDIAALEIEIASLRRERQRIENSVRTYQEKVDQSPKREQELIALTRDYENLRRSYDDLLSKKLQADISQNLERRQKGEQFQILDPANIPEIPFQPKRLRIYLLSFAASVMIGIGGVLVLAYTDATVRTPEEFRHFFKVPLIVALPAIQNERAGRKIRARRRLMLGGCVLFLAAATVLLSVFGDGFHLAIRRIGGMG